MSLFQQGRVLPFEHPVVDLYPHHALAFGILQNNEHILPLLLTDYIQLVYDTSVQRMDFSISLYIQSYVKHIPMTFHALVPGEIVEHGYKNRIEFVQTAIENGYYVYCLVDTYYIEPYLKCFHKIHMLHDITIYGYDKKKREYYTGDCFVDGKYKRAVVSEKELAAGLQIAEEENWLDGYVLLKYNESPYRGVTYDVEELKKAVTDYVNAEPSGWIAVSEYRRRVPWFYVYGIGVYDAFCEYLDEKERMQETLDLRLPEVLVEHKRVMLKIAQQLHEMGKLAQIEEVQNAFSELIDMTRNMELRMAKYNAGGASGGLLGLKNLLRDI